MVGQAATETRAQASRKPNAFAHAFFVGIKVGGALVLSGTYFYTPVDFTYAEAKSEFLSDDVHYESADVADFDSFKAKGPVFFRRDHFAGGLVLSDAELSSLNIEDALPSYPRSATPGGIELEINEAQIAHSLDIKRVILTLFQAGYLVVHGPAEFEDLSLAGRVDLRHSYFSNLTIKGFDSWLKKDLVEKLDLEGLSFDSIDIPGTKVGPSAARMLDLIKLCSYSPQPYLEFEKFLSSHGFPAEADVAYIEMRRRQRSQLSASEQPFDLVVICSDSIWPGAMAGGDLCARACHSRGVDLGEVSYGARR